MRQKAQSWKAIDSLATIIGTPDLVLNMRTILPIYLYQVLIVASK